MGNVIGIRGGKGGGPTGPTQDEVLMAFVKDMNEALDKATGIAYDEQLIFLLEQMALELRLAHLNAEVMDDDS